MKTFRPRFTVRTLAIFVTLVCGYFGAWEVTKREATRRKRAPESKEITWKGKEIPLPLDESPAPLIISQLEMVGMVDFDKPKSKLSTRRRYYLWLFGPRIRLPFELDHTQDLE